MELWLSLNAGTENEAYDNAFCDLRPTFLPADVKPEMGSKHPLAGPGWTPHRMLVLPIPRERWAPPDEGVEVDGLLFLPKRELHLTLIGRGLGQVLHGDPSRRQAVREAFSRLNWGFTRTGELLRLEKRELAGGGHGRAIGSIIERIELPAMVPFYESLAALLGRTLAIPPPHVTLYTAGRSQGIGVPDVATLRRLVVRQVPALGSPPGERPSPRAH